MGEENRTRDVADAVRGVLEKAPIYEDVLQPAAKQVGRALETIASLLPLAVAPIKGVHWTSDKIGNWIKGTLARRLENRPVEKLIRPAQNIAGPMLRSLPDVMDIPELREMYAALLATTMDADVAMMAHPGFVKVIEQLTADEAKLLTWMSKQPTEEKFLMVDIYSKDPLNQVYVLRRFSVVGLEAACVHPELTTSYLENFMTLGLFEVAIEQNGRSKLHSKIRSHPDFISAISRFGWDDSVIAVSRMVVTAYGRRFFASCVCDLNDQPNFGATD